MITIALKDLKLLIRDKASLFWVLIFPASTRARSRIWLIRVNRFCDDSSTPAMGALVVNAAIAAAKLGAASCKQPTPFVKVNGDYTYK